MRLIAKVKFHCNRLTTVQGIQDYASLIFGTHCILYVMYYTVCPEKAAPYIKYINTHNTEQKSLKITQNTLTSI